MEVERIEPKLSAILCADVLDYSRRSAPMTKQPSPASTFIGASSSIPIVNRYRRKVHRQTEI